MKKYIVFSFLAISLNLFSNSLKFNWVTTTKDGESKQTEGIFSDSSGALYRVGSFLGQVDFDPSSGSQIVNSINNSQDFYIEKINTDGSLVWVKTFGSKGKEAAEQITVSNNGDIYVSGSFSSKIIFNTMLGVDSISNDSLYNKFILKMNSSGDLSWIKSFGSGKLVKIEDLSVSIDNELFVGGILNSPIDIDFSANTHLLKPSNPSQDDAFVFKIDSNAKFKWGKVIEKSGNQNVAKIRCDLNGDIYISSQNEKDIAFLIKLSNEGEFVRELVFGGLEGGKSSISTLSVDQQNNVFLGGIFDYIIDFDPSNGLVEKTSQNGVYDCYVLKLNEDGEFQWVNVFGGPSREIINGGDCDPNGNLILTGRFSGGKMDYKTSKGDKSLIGSYNDNAYVMKMSPNGEIVHTFALGDLLDDEGRYVAANSDKRVYISGLFNNVGEGIDFDPGVGIFKFPQSDEVKPFLLSLSNCKEVQISDSIISCGPYTWIDGKTYQKSNNTATFIVNNINGCDSVFYLNLVVNKADAPLNYENGIISVNETSETYKWLECDKNYSVVSGEIGQSFIPKNKGKFAVEVTQNGCIDTSDCVVHIPVNLDSLNFEWVYKIDGSGAVYNINIASIDSESFYVSGNFQGKIDLDPGQDSLIFNHVNGFFIQKMDENRDPIWTRVWGGGLDVKSKFVLDSLNNIYVAGAVSGTVDFDPGNDKYELTPTNGSSFFMKITSSGAFEWAKTIEPTTNGSNQIVTIESFAVSINNEIVITGNFNTEVDFNSGLGDSILSPTQGYDVYILKFNKSGDFIWVNTLDNELSYDAVHYDEAAKDICFDGLGNIIVLARFQGAIKINSNSSSLEVYSSQPYSYSLLCLKLSETGNPKWIKIIDTKSDDVSNVISNNNNEIIISGTYEGKVDFDPSHKGVSMSSESGGFLVKLNESGEYNWHKTMLAAPGFAFLDMVSNNNDDIYLTGYFEEDISSPLKIKGNGSTDVFIMKISLNEEIFIYEPIGGNGMDIGEKISVDNNGGIYVGGSYKSKKVDFDPSAGVYELTGEGVKETTFILKFGEREIYQTYQTETACSTFKWINGVSYMESVNNVTYLLNSTRSYDSIANLNLTIIPTIELKVSLEGKELKSSHLGDLQWLDCNNSFSEILNETNQVYIPVRDGRYSFKLTRTGCKDTSDCISYFVLGQENLTNKSEIIVLPNPFKDRINISSNHIETVDIKIFTSEYDEVFEIKGLVIPAELNDFNLAKGVYFLRIKSENGIIYKRMLVN